MESEFICGLGEIPENSEMAELVRESENCFGFISNHPYQGEIGQVMELNDKIIIPNLTAHATLNAPYHPLCCWVKVS